MKNITLRVLIKKCSIYYGLLGLVIALIMFIAVLNNTNIPFYMSDSKYYGVKAGLLSIIFLPPIMAFVGLGHAVMLWYPIVFIIRYFSKKVCLKGK